MKVKILIVDDNQANLDTLRYLINDIEFEDDSEIEVLEAINGNDALAISIKEDLAFIILDIQMPKMDGFEVAKYLKKSSKTKDIPIAFLTAAFKSDQMREYGLHLGAYDYFFKPIDPLIIVPKIKLYVEFYSVTHKLKEMNLNLENKVAQEIEKNKIMEKKLFQAEKLSSMAEMISNIAHQWRQPLSVISTAATGIKAQKEYDILTDEFLLESLDTINDTSQYLSRVIDNFKNFIVKEDGAKVKYNLKDVIDKVLQIESSIIKQNNLNIITDIPENLSLYGFANSLVQCFVNLLNNSSEALHDKEYEKLIFIKATQLEDKVVIEFKDNGGGIKKEHINKVFEPYFTTKNKSQGTGLGLYMIHSIVNTILKGTIKVQNVKYEYKQSQYKGAMFILQLNKGQ